MPIWKLTPIDLFDGTWPRSVHKESAVIRAPTESVARSVAALAFVAPAEEMSRLDDIVPWRNPMHVRAEQLDESNWTADGPVMILEPAGFEVDYSNVTFTEE